MVTALLKSRNKITCNTVFKNILDGLLFNHSFEKHLEIILVFNIIPFTVTQMIFNKLLLCFLKPGSGLKIAGSVRGEEGCLNSFSRGLRPLLLVFPQHQLPVATPVHG